MSRVLLVGRKSAFKHFTHDEVVVVYLSLTWSLNPRYKLLTGFVWDIARTSRTYVGLLVAGGFVCSHLAVLAVVPLALAVVDGTSVVKSTPRSTGEVLTVHSLGPATLLGVPVVTSVVLAGITSLSVILFCLL